jgi:hypothetical protein
MPRKPLHPDSGSAVAAEKFWHIRHVENDSVAMGQLKKYERRLIQHLDGLSTRAKVSLVAGLFCVGTYVFLSAAGNWERAGEYMEWTPYGASLDVRITSSGTLRTKGSFLGFVFAPLTVVDRMAFHRSLPINSPKGQEAYHQDESRRSEAAAERLREGH